MYVETLVENYNSVEFQQNFRIIRPVFERLNAMYAPYCAEILDTSKSTISTKTQLLSIIWLLANQESFRSVGERFDLAKSSLAMVFFRVINYLNEIAGTIIKWPTEAEMAISKQTFKRKCQLDGIIGAVDGTYVPMKAPTDQKLAYTNRKSFTSMTLQAICDQNMKYIVCFAGFPSSAHDSRVFRNSDIYISVRANKQLYFPTDEKILGDSAYPLENWCIIPFINRENLTAMEKHFNYKQAYTRLAYWQYCKSPARLMFLGNTVNTARSGLLSGRASCGSGMQDSYQVPANMIL